MYLGSILASFHYSVSFYCSICPRVGDKIFQLIQRNKTQDSMKLVSPKSWYDDDNVNIILLHRNEKGILKMRKPIKKNKAK